MYSKTLEEHKEHLRVVFEELRAHQLYVNAKKSEFFLQEIRYLGHIISKDGIRMDPEKLKVIEEWPVPKNIHEVRSFIGMCSYYRRFIAKFAIIAGPLHDLTKKKVKFQWTLKEHNAFMTLTILGSHYLQRWCPYGSSKVEDNRGVNPTKEST